MENEPPGWRSGLRHCITVLAVLPETLGSRPGSVAAGHDQEVRGATHNWPSVVRVREGLAGRDTLVSSRTSDSFWVGCALLKKLCGLVGLCFGGRMVFDLRLSRARMGVVAMRQDSNY